MTAEVAIMNRTAVALAADSAVTIGGGQNVPKIYNTVNKLFMLSKYHPVGIMVYGNAEFMRIPWETVIKMYRNHLGARSFDALDGYVSSYAKENWKYYSSYHWYARIQRVWSYYAC